MKIKIKIKNGKLVETNETDNSIREKIEKILTPENAEKYRIMRTDKDTVLLMRDIFKEGSEISLIKMYDSQAPKRGAKGIVRGVDDIGNLLVKWESGSSLGLIVWEDSFILHNNS